MNQHITTIREAICNCCPNSEALTSLDALEAAMREPVAWVERDGELVWCDRKAAIGRNLYVGVPPATPPAQQAQPKEPTRQSEWANVPQAFRDWWNSDYDDSTNPFRVNSAAYWAWAGWSAAQQAQPSDLQRIEQYRMQMAGISTAAIGYWKEGDTIHPDYDTVALRDVAKLYAKYDELYRKQAQAEAVPDPRPVIEMCAKALAEELAAWDIDPPLHHVKEASDACEAWLAAAQQGAKT